MAIIEDTEVSQLAEIFAIKQPMAEDNKDIGSA